MVESDIPGYAGKFLRVDLSSEKISDFVFDNETLRKYVGGHGIGVKILYDEVSPSAHWSDPSNRVILASGPLGGTSFPATGTFCVVTKGALTNGCTACQANGLFGAYMRLSGYDGLVIQGAAKRWMYLNMKEDGAELKDASHLLRRDTYETDDLIKKEQGKKDREMSIVSIGPAGENLCLFAGVFSGKGRSASHNGTGAVLGSKKLKAIAVPMGKKRVVVKDPERFKSVVDKVRERVKRETSERPARGGGGSTWKTPGRGTLPIKNYTTNLWDLSEEQLETFSESYISENFNVRANPCWACVRPLCQHGSLMTIPEGPYKGTVIKRPYYEAVAAMGPVIDVRNYNETAVLTGICDKLGFDVNEMGWVLAWTMECYERGLITKEDLGGLEMNWGNAEAAKQLMYMIAHRQGFGNTLAEGIMRASKKTGGEAARAAIYTLKGNTPRGHDHRTMWGEMFDTVVSNTGTIETHTILSAVPPYNAGAGRPKETVEGVALTKGILSFVDSLGNCREPTGLNLNLLTEALASITGWDLTPEEAKDVGLRAVNLMKAFNLRVGFGKELDAPSERYGSTPIDGPTEGISIQPHLESMLREYYSLMGWDENTGKPLPQTLKRLGLEHIIKDIW